MGVKMAVCGAAKACCGDSECVQARCGAREVLKTRVRGSAEKIVVG